MDVEQGLICSITAGLGMVKGLKAVTFDRVKKAVLSDDYMVRLRDTIYDQT